MGGRSLNELFADNEGAPITVDGRLLHSSYERQVLGGTRFVVTRVSTHSRYLQGLEVKVEKAAQLSIDGVRSRGFKLWENQARARLTIDVVAKGPTTLRVWNLWLVDSVEWAWSHDASILVDESPGGDQVTLRCRDGFSPPDYDNLVIQLHFEAST